MNNKFIERQANDIFLYAVPMSIVHAELICTWRYETPYDAYNFPSWETMKQEQKEFADEHIRNQQYFSICNDQNKLIAFFQLFPFSCTTRIGVFIEPASCGKGLGKPVMQIVIAAAKQLYPHKQIDLEVAAWNERAIRLYQSSSFQIDDEYELYNRSKQKEEKVYCMVYKNDLAGS